MIFYEKTTCAHDHLGQPKKGPKLNQTTALSNFNLETFYPFKSVLFNWPKKSVPDKGLR